MLTKTLILFVTIRLIQAQMNGEFWWLNNNLNKYRKVNPPPPKIEELEDWETDESVKIIFRDENDLTNYKKHNRTSKNITIDDKLENLSDNYGESTKNLIENSIRFTNSNDKIVTEDKFVFNYPNNGTRETSDEEEIVTNSNNNNNTKINDDIPKEKDRSENGSTNIDIESQSICTFVQKYECLENKGVVHNNNERNQNDAENKRICCILPLKPVTKRSDLSFIYFPDMDKSKINKRFKRENREKTLSQRDFLLIQKFSAATRKKPAPTLQTKIVTPSETDDVDPYWNIKNSNFQTENKHKIQSDDYYSEDYTDYAAELPRPGLVGLYSDHAKAPSSWGSTGKGYGAINYEDSIEEEEEEDTFGYSTLDPRKDERTKKLKTKPAKIATTSGEVTYNAESQTINFQSNPDFHVLQGFKLLNLVRNQSKVFTKKIRATTDRNDENEEVLISRPFEDSAEDVDEYFEGEQLFGECGKSVTVKNYRRDKQIGDAANGSHPWMALVVLTKRRQTVLCYATLIHPRAAVTAADCVEGTTAKEITVIAGVWDLNDRSTARNRVVTVHIHPRYRTGNVDNNLAILYWMRPIKLGVNVQPACLAEPHIDDECKFFGWGSLADGIQLKSRWQRASIQPCEFKSRNKRSVKQSEIFCASVSRGAVTGLGGAMICDVDGQSSIIGVIVSTENGYELMPVREFALKSSNLLKGD